MNSNKDDIFLDHNVKKDFDMISMESGTAEYIRFFAENDQLVWAEYLIQEYSGNHPMIIFKVFGIFKKDLEYFIKTDSLNMELCHKFDLRIPQFLPENGRIDLTFFENHTLQGIPDYKSVTNDEIFERYSPKKERGRE